MYRREYRHHLLLADLFLPFGGKLSGDNRWIKLAELIPWNALEDYYAAQVCKGFGAPAKPFRMAHGARCSVRGALIIKARLNLTDEELVEQIQHGAISPAAEHQSAHPWAAIEANGGELQPAGIW